MSTIAKAISEQVWLTTMDPSLLRSLVDYYFVVEGFATITRGYSVELQQSGEKSKAFPNICGSGFLPDSA